MALEMFDLQPGVGGVGFHVALHFLKETFEVCDFYLQCFNLYFLRGSLASYPLCMVLCFGILGSPFNRKLAV